MNHFTNGLLTSPFISIFSGYVYIVGLALVFESMGLYEKSSFFTWGTPVTFMGVKISDDTTYYILLLLFFVHSLINNWIHSVTYPWIMDYVQDPKSYNLRYSNKTTILIVNMFAFYSELDMILTVFGIISQGAFSIMIILANMVFASLINWRAIQLKNKFQKNENKIFLFQKP